MRDSLEILFDVGKNSPEFMFYHNALEENPNIDLNELEKEYHNLYFQEAYQGNATIKFYKSPNGNNPVKEFLNSLDSQMLEEVKNNIDKLKKQGANAKYPLINNLGDKIFELRTMVNKGKGNNWIRILYFWMPGNTIVMTNGFMKKSNETPPGEIKIAKKRREEFLKRN